MINKLFKVKFIEEEPKYITIANHIKSLIEDKKIDELDQSVIKHMISLSKEKQIPVFGIKEKGGMIIQNNQIECFGQIEKI